MEKIDRDTFFEITSTFDIVPYTQTRGMYDFHALSGVERIVFFVNSIDNPQIACFGHEKRMFTKKMILIESECYISELGCTVENVRRFYVELSKLNYDCIEVCSNSKYSFDYEVCLRQAGYLRPVGLFSMPVTKVIDLTKEIEYGRNWKRKLKKVENNNLILDSVENISMSDCIDFVRMYDEMLDRKSLKGHLTAEQIMSLCLSGTFALFFVKKEDRRIAAIVIHKNQTHAGLLYAATGKEALELLASFFMYQSLFHMLKGAGFKSFDMEKLVPSTSSVNNVFLFKNGIHGEHTILNGEFSWYKKQYYRPLMYFVKKYIMKKREI